MTGPRSEAALIRDPLASYLRANGWHVQIEVTIPRWGRCDIVARRDDTHRVIECKLIAPLHGIPQVLGYAIGAGEGARPTLALPQSILTDAVKSLCLRCDIDLWVEGADWPVTKRPSRTQATLEIPRNQKVRRPVGWTASQWKRRQDVLKRDAQWKTFMASQRGKPTLLELLGGET